MNFNAGTISTMAVECGDLTLGEGLLAIVRPALDLLEPGGLLSVLSIRPALKDDLSAWCRLEHHQYLSCDTIGGRERHLIARGSLNVPLGTREGGITLPFRDGKMTAADMLACVPMPDRADPTTGFAPRGARVEPGGPAYPFSLLDCGHTAPPEVAMLFDQAVGSQWNAATDIPWHTIKPLAPRLENAVGQVMTFLAENEVSALYVPSRFISRIHPAYLEVSMFLATHMADEARHIDVFLKRARAAGGGLGVSSVTTSRSLLSLLEITDFTEAAFLLSVLGEGTFIDLLRFVEEYAPDEATAELARRARLDESRHVHFGLAHVRHALRHDAGLFGRLESAVRRRAASMHGAGEAPAAVQDALTILAAGGDDPAAVRKGHEAYRILLANMSENRIKRLENAGFTAAQSQTLSDLHTPNFM